MFEEGGFFFLVEAEFLELVGRIDVYCRGEVREELVLSFGCVPFDI